MGQALVDEKELRPEHEVRDYAERGVQVRAFLYEGPFHLEILSRGEEVRSAGDGSGDCLVYYNPSDKTKFFRLPIGYWIVNRSDVGLMACTPEDFERQYILAAPTREADWG